MIPPGWADDSGDADRVDRRMRGVMWIARSMAARRDLDRSTEDWMTSLDRMVSAARSIH
jgi:hypothetical protein